MVSYTRIVEAFCPTNADDYDRQEVRDYILNEFGLIIDDTNWEQIAVFIKEHRKYIKSINTLKLETESKEKLKEAINSCLS